MDRKGELLKNSLIIFIGKFCTQLLSFFMMPLYTHFILTKDYGYIDLVQSYIALFVPILVLRFDSAVFRFLIDHRGDKEKQSIIITNTLKLLFIQIIIFVVLAFILKQFIEIEYIYFIILNIIFMSLSQILLQITRGIGDNINYSVASIITGIVNVSLNLLLILKFKFGGSSILISSAAANFICSLYLFFKNKIHTYIKNGDQAKLKEMLKYSLPMIPDGLSWWVVNVSDRTIISFLIDNAANGIYAISCKFSNVLSTVFQVFNMSWQENASLHINDKDNSEYFTEILNSTFKLFYSVCILILVCVPFVFKFMIGISYQDAYHYVPILLYGNLFNALAIILGGVYIAKKQTKKVANTTMFGAIINIIINLLLIKRIGLWAAAISTMVSYILLYLYRYIDVQKYVRMKQDFMFLFLSTLIFGMVTLIYLYKIFIWDIINLIFVSIFVIILNKDFIITSFKKIKKLLSKGKKQ